MKLLPTVEAVLDRTGLMDHDCHKNLPRDSEYRGIGLKGGAISIEEAMLIVGLAWSIRPDIILELGTARGASTVVLAAALKDIGKGKVITVDKAAHPPEKARAIAEEFKLPIQFEIGRLSTEYLKSQPPIRDQRHLVFSDTDIPVRPMEVQHVIDTYPSGTFIVVHDTDPGHPFGPMNLEKLVRTRPIVKLPSPRGLSILEV